MTSSGWWRLCRLEFIRSLSGIFRKGPGGSDLLGVSAISGMLIALIALMSSLHGGIVVNFADSLLGNTPGAGVPLRVLTDSSLGTGARLQDAFTLLGNAKQLTGLPTKSDSRLAPYELHPAEEVEAGAEEISLPGSDDKEDGPKSWDLTLSSNKTAFVGWAVALSSPLWTWANVPGDDQDQLYSLLGNSSAFLVHFRRAEYIDSLEKILPPDIVKRWSDENSSSRLPTTLYFEIPAPGGHSLSEFKMHWFQSFPTPQKLAFIMPLETYKALSIARFNKQTAVFPSVIGGSRDRAAVLHLYDADRIKGTTVNELSSRLATCLSADPFNREIAIEVHLKMRLPLPKAWVNSCLASAGLQLNRDIEIETVDTLKGIVLRRGLIEYSCADVPTNQFLPERAQNACSADANGRAAVSPYFGSTMGLLYVPDRMKVVAATTALLETRLGDRQAFVLSGLYQDSLARFSYLVSTLQFMVKPASLFGLFVVIYVLNFQIATWISHRRKHYGVLLARGFNWLDIYKMCMTQVFFATLVGVLVAVVVEEGAKILFNQLFRSSDAASLAVTRLGILTPSVTDSLKFTNLSEFMTTAATSVDHLLTATLTIMCLNLILLTAVLWRQHVRPQVAPISLISSGAS